MPQQRKKEESERLRGERDQIKFIDLGCSLTELSEVICVLKYMVGVFMQITHDIELQEG